MEIYNSLINTNSLKKEKNINFKNKTVPIQQITDKGLKFASGAIASIGIASIAMNQKKQNIPEEYYEECPEIVRAMSRFTPEELSLFAKSENYDNIEYLSALKFITPEGKEQYRYNAQEILELTNIDNMEDFRLLADLITPDKKTGHYCSRFTNDDLKYFLEKETNLKLIYEFATVTRTRPDNSEYTIYNLNKHAFMMHANRYEAIQKEIEEGIKNIEDEHLRHLLELDYVNLQDLPINLRENHQNYLLKKIDAYNNLINRYTTFKAYTEKEPSWLEFIKYCRKNNISIKNKGTTEPLYNDFFEQQRSEFLMKACRDEYSKTFKHYSIHRDHDLDYIYEEIYLNTLPSSVKLTSSDKDLLKEINQKFNTKIFLPTSTFRRDKIEYIKKELEKWSKAGSDGVRFPPTIDLLRAKRDYIDNTSAYGSSKSAGYYYSAGSGEIALDGYAVVEWAIRHELMHANDWKQLDEFPEKWYETDGKTVKQEIKNKFYNEFRKGNLNISKSHFEYAFNNPMEFIAVAAEGDISKYSQWFIDQLIEFGMPEWAVNLRQH